MSSNNSHASSVVEYIAGFEGEVRHRLETLRALVREVAPDARERISYGMPTYSLGGTLLHFAAYRTHIGIYPTPGTIEQMPELTRYVAGKGTLRFPLDEPLPLELIRRVVEQRARECADRAGSGRL